MIVSRLLPAAATILIPLSSAWAQFESNFEAPVYTASASGVPLAGQDGFTVPGPLDVDGRCFLYNGNTLGIAANPLGGEQFVALTRATGAFARAEHAVTIDIGQDEACWYLELDLCLHYVGTLPTVNYAGSVSLQPFPGGGSLILLFYWDNVSTAETYTVRVLGFARDGSIPYLAGLPIANAGFRGLSANRWYRFAHRIEFGANAMTGLSVRDIANEGPTHGLVSYIDPDDASQGHIAGYYLGGGEQFSGVPTACRLFAGGGTAGDQIAGNTLAIDNLRVIPQPRAECYGDLDLNGSIGLQDLANLLSNFGNVGAQTYFDGDMDCDGDVDLNDLTLLLSRFGIVCA